MMNMLELKLHDIIIINNNALILYKPKFYKWNL